MHKYIAPSIPEIRAIQRNAMDHILVCDVGEFASLVEKHENANAAQRVRQGDANLTHLADRYLNEFENELFSGRGWKTVDTVAGAAPNVPAFLAGTPNAMRLRVRTSSAYAPLCLFFELTGSSGCYGNDTMMRRGAAMFALARLLANSRPIEFWALTTYGQRDKLQMVACKIETTPFATAHAAFQLMSQDMARFGVRVNSGEFGHFRHGWAYGVPDLERRYSGEILRRIVHPGAEILHIPAMYFEDQNTGNPSQWVRDMLAKYGPEARNEWNDAA